jgi:hypothetical protein
MEPDIQRAAAVRLEHAVPPKKKRKATTDTTNDTTSGGAPEDPSRLPMTPTATPAPTRHGREGAAVDGRALHRSPSFEEPPVELAPTPPSTFFGPSSPRVVVCQRVTCVVAIPYVCERRQEAVVLHPGSHTLKLGMATDDLPVVMPHLVARRVYDVRPC